MKKKGTAEWMLLLQNSKELPVYRQWKFKMDKIIFRIASGMDKIDWTATYTAQTSLKTKR